MKPTSRTMPRPVTCAGASFLALLSLPLAACGDEPALRQPHVIVLSLDTVRADRFSCYGAPEGSTPRMDAFARGADRYESCSATSSWTLPSHASMFTGLFPFEHGSHGFEVDGMIDNVHPLHPDHVTFAEELGGFGYDTAAFVANNVYLAKRYGMDQGFDTYEVHHERAAEVMGRALAHVDRHLAKDTDRPLLLFVNVMDAHRPYMAYSDEELAALPREQDPSGLLEDLCKQVMNRGEAPGELGDRVSELYSRAIHRLDAEVGGFLDALDKKGILEGAVVVITSDHGEAFGTHGIVEHAKDVYEPLVAVPLIVRLPGQPDGRVIRERASLVDVPGLIARGLTGNAGGVARNTFPRVPGTHPVTSEIHFARPRDIVLYKTQFQHERTALREGDMKLILGGPDVQLFDLAEDPGELLNLASARPGPVTAMTATLDEFIATYRYTGERLQPRALSDEANRAMNALGYGRGGAAESKASSVKDDGPR